MTSANIFIIIAVVLAVIAAVWSGRWLRKRSKLARTEPVTRSEGAIMKGAANEATPPSRKVMLATVTLRLITFTAISLALTTAVFSAVFFYGGHLFMSWLAFECGLLGGFVSIQQRLRTLGDDELSMLTESWAQLLLIPVFGAIFAQLLYVVFLAGLLQGDLFPKFYMPPFGDAPNDEVIRKFLTGTYPLTGSDFAKLLFWAFVAGFSERFVPQIVNAMATRAEGADSIEARRSVNAPAAPAGPLPAPAPAPAAAQSDGRPESTPPVIPRTDRPTTPGEAPQGASL